MRISINKNYLFHLTGCAIFLFIGVYGWKAKAVDYPSITEIKEHWKKESCCEVFAALYSQEGTLSLVSENLPKDGQGKPTASFEMYFKGKPNPFKTVSDLDQLPCDAHLKKICKVLCSSKFLETVLLPQTVDVFRKNAGETRLEIYVSNPDSFFDEYDKGKLKMCIERGTEESDGKFLAQFVFVFKKSENDVEIEGARFRCELPNGESKRYSPGPLPNFPFNDVLQAPERIANVWKNLSDAPLIEVVPFDVSVKWTEYVEHDEKISKILSKLRRVDFFEGVFGKRMWGIFQHQNCVSVYTQGLLLGYIFKPYYKGNRIDTLDVRLWIMDAHKNVSVYSILECEPEMSECSLDVIPDLHFTLDIKNDKILNAKYCGNLKLNGMSIVP